MVLVHNHIVPPGLISLLCQLLAPRLELLQHRCRLFRRRGLLRQFGSLVVGDGRRLVSKVMFQGRLRGCRSCSERASGRIESRARQILHRGRGD